MIFRVMAAQAGKKRRSRSLRPPMAASRGRRAARRTIAILPTAFTLANALCGFLAIFLASRPETSDLPWQWSPLTFAAVMIFIGMICDGLDGQIARLTRHTSDLGEQLDSMSDMITFGAAPAFLTVTLVGVGTPFLSSEAGDRFFDRLALICACIYVACAALRLARFNIETKSADSALHTSFEGLPSPAAAGTVASLVLLHQSFDLTRHHLTTVSEIGMVAVTLLTGLAMVSQLPYVHILNRYVRGRAPFEYIALAVIVVLLLAIAPQASIATGFVIYALFSPLAWVYRKIIRRSANVDTVDTTIVPAKDDQSHSGQ